MSLTIIFLIVVVTMYPFAVYSGVQIPVSTLIALLVCLIPTTIGGLLSAIGIAGMDRVTRFNVIAMSGKAVEACGDVDTMILDKTGTITFGNRLAADFFPVEGASRSDLIRCAALTSLHDDTPEGKSTLELARRLGFADKYCPKMLDVTDWRDWDEQVIERIYKPAYEKWAEDENGLLGYYEIEPPSWEEFQKLPIVRVPGEPASGSTPSRTRSNGAAPPSRRRPAR